MEATRLRRVIISHDRPCDKHTSTQMYFSHLMLNLEAQGWAAFSNSAGFQILLSFFVTVELGMCLKAYICWGLAVENVGSCLRTVNVSIPALPFQLCAPGTTLTSWYPRGQRCPALLGLL